MNANEQRRALVTGANRGIGRAVAAALVGDGWRVWCGCRRAEAAVGAAASLGAGAEPLTLDLADEASIVAAFAALGRAGGLDLLVNNAGIGRFGTVADLDPADLDAVLAVNLRGTAICCREALALMRPAGAGTILTIASVVAHRGYPNQAVYSASKHAVLGLCKSLAAECQADGIRVSVVSPGGVDTDMVRDARPDLDPETLIAAEDVADAVRYLVSLSPRVAVDEIVLRRRGAAPF